MSQIEILAPAGSVESMKAAINAGCDAVYIGGSKFGARAYANNLDQDTLLSAIDYVHVKGKQLYLTVNTLLKNEELKNDLYEYLDPLYRQGLDAVIVQDVGAMHFIHEHFPDLPIHASTQMTLTMAEGVNQLKKYGVTRIVPARELGIKEIQRIRQSTNLEIEAFVHGALCYSYSGQCFLSSMIGGRSGNRGRCAQPCRMEYKAQEGCQTVSQADNSYILSPKDMCTLPMTADLIEAGIDSFKIEGRMKRPEYAAGVVLAYRKQADLYYELGAEGYREYHKRHPKEMETEMQKLKDLYNRGGFSTGYYEAHNGKQMMSMHRPNHSGVLIGKVTGRKGIQAEVTLCEDVNAQDILEFRHRGEKTYDFTLKDGAKKGKKITTNTKPGSRIELGDEVYRTKNEMLLTELSDEFMETEIKMPIQGTLTATVGQPLTLTVSTMAARQIPGTNIVREPQEVCVTVTGDCVDEALKQPVNAANLEDKLRKTKETPFEFTKVDIQINGNAFFPVGKLNEIRRSALAQLEEKLAVFYRRNGNSEKEKSQQSDENVSTSTSGTVYAAKRGSNKKRSKQGIPGIIAYVKTMEQFRAACESEEITDIYVDLAENSFLSIKEYGNVGALYHKNVFLTLPHIFRADAYDEFAKNQEFLQEETIAGYVIKNFEELSFVKDVLNTEKELRLDYNMYVMNEEAIQFYHEFGIEHYTASIELNQNELSKLPLEHFDMVVYGYLPLMISAQCVKKNTTACRLRKGKDEDWLHQEPILLTDRMQMKFGVRTNCHYCYNQIFNAQCLSLFGNMNEVTALQPQNVRLDFTSEDSAQTRKVIADCVDALQGAYQESDRDNYSKGHFKRGIL